MSKSQAHYRPAPTPEVRCDHCKFMFPRLGVGGCRFVRGTIRSSGHLRFVYSSRVNGS